MSEEINRDHRRLLGTAILTMAATELAIGGGSHGPTASENMTIWISGLRQAPVIAVPTITLEGDANGAPHLDASAYAKKFSGQYSHRVINGGIGHNLPQEAPQAFAQAVVDVDAY